MQDKYFKSCVYDKSKVSLMHNTILRIFEKNGNIIWYWHGKTRMKSSDEAQKNKCWFLKSYAKFKKNVATRSSNLA